MTVNSEVIAALSEAIDALETDAPHPIPTHAVAALAGIAKTGTRLRIDLAASAAIGAPLVTVERRGDNAPCFDALTRRQKDVARLIAKGQSNKEIAKNLGISVATVKDHVHAILQRLELPSRAAVIATARP